MPVELRHLFGPAGPLAGLLKNYEPRSAQAAMAEAVYRGLRDGGGLLVEAGTGTGKSLAYLIPALELGGTKAKVVVATHTIALQQQLMSVDVPLARDALGTDKPTALLQGRTNYLCQRKLHRQQLLGLIAGRGAAERQRKLFELAKNARRGDRAEVPFRLPSAEWLSVASSPDTCARSACPFHGDCFYQRARRRAQGAALIVTNHALLLTDAVMRAKETQVLPDYEHLIIDEAHRLEDSATSALGRMVSLGRLRALRRDLYSQRRKRGLLAAVVQTKVLEEGELLRRLSDLNSAGERHFADLDEQLPHRGERIVIEDRFRGENALALQLAALADWLKESAAGVDEEDAAEISGAVGRLRDFAADLEALEERELEDFVYWAQRSEPAAPPELHAAPVEVGPLLGELLWPLAGGVTATSATLTVGGRFNYVRSRLGFPPGSELSLPGGFDYAAQTALYLPRLPDPRHDDYYPAAAAEIIRLVKLVERGGSLILCTSYRALRRFNELTAGELEPLGYQLFAQGDADRSQLLRSFKQARRGVLFATATFWEGVDLPGDQLRLLVIAKLPFAVPTDPVIRARGARLEERGINPFMAYSVPVAALRLRQGFGRLIRGRDDRGVVAVLDSRVLTKRYGRVFLDSLPPARRVPRFDPVVLSDYLN